jgi:hypothetical protein
MGGNSESAPTSAVIWKSRNRILVTDGIRWQRLSLRSDDLEPVGELHSENEFGQLVATVEAPPAFLGGLGELKYHGECGLVRVGSAARARSLPSSSVASAGRSPGMPPADAPWRWFSLTGCAPMFRRLAACATDRRSSHFGARSVCFELAGRRGVTVLKALVFGNHLRAEQQDDAGDFEAQQPNNSGRQRTVDDADH